MVKESDSKRSKEPKEHRSSREDGEREPLRSRGLAHKQRWALTIGLFASALVFVLAILPMSQLAVFGDPHIALHVKSDAIAFVPAENVNLVSSARPRHGILASGEIYEGIRFHPPPYLSSVRASLEREGTVGNGNRDFTGRSEPRDIVVVKHLEVTPGCELRIERLPDTRVHLMIRQDPMATAEADRPLEANWFTGFISASSEEEEAARDCWLHAAITSVDDTFSTAAIRRSVEAGERVELRFRPSDRPLQFRRLKVRDLGFTEKGEHGLRSAILGGELRLPGHGNREERVELGDRLRFGDRVRGEIVELSVGDTIRTNFKGHSSRPVIESRDITPAALGHLYHHERSIIFGVVFGIFALILAFFQIRD